MSAIDSNRSGPKPCPVTAMRRGIMSLPKPIPRSFTISSRVDFNEVASKAEEGIASTRFLYSPTSSAESSFHFFIAAGSTSWGSSKKNRPISRSSSILLTRSLSKPTAVTRFCLGIASTKSPSMARRRAAMVSSDCWRRYCSLYQSSFL